MHLLGHGGGVSAPWIKLAKTKKKGNAKNSPGIRLQVKYPPFLQTIQMHVSVWNFQFHIPKSMHLPQFEAIRLTKKLQFPYINKSLFSTLQHFQAYSNFCGYAVFFQNNLYLVSHSYNYFFNICFSPFIRHQDSRGQCSHVSSSPNPQHLARC